jgi:bifunctional non-homologous end joining protein LigD
MSASLAMRDLLSDLSLTSFVKTTGGKGLHVVVPLERRHTWPEVKQFAKAVSNVLASSDAEHYTLSMSKAARPGKIFIDYLRNERGATAVVAYSTRARANAPVSMPLAWKELRRVAGPAAFTIENAPSRLDRLARDFWADLLEVKQTITAIAKKRLKIK